MSYIFNNQISWQLICDKIFVFDESANTVNIFEDTAKEIWLYISKGLGSGDMITELSIKFGVQESQVKDDVLEFIGNLSSLNLISVGGGVLCN